MSKVVKCVSCNVVIDELLSYIQNKISVIDEDTLVRLCTSSFSSEDIEKSKTLLYESVPVEKAKIKRKNKGKEQRDLVDIINVFRSVEPDQFPIFVARDLEKLPPILFDHLDCTKLLKDLLLLQNEIKEIKKEYVTQTQLKDLKTDLLKMQNDSLIPTSLCKLNMKRGGWLLESGPVGLSHVSNSSVVDDCNNSIDESSLQILDNNEQLFRKMKEVGEENFDRGSESAVLPQRPAERSPPSPRVATASARARTYNAVARSTTPRQKPLTSPERARVHMSQTASTARESVQNKDGWEKVSYRRKRNNMNYRYMGSAGTARDNEGKFKAAIKTVPIFITKVHKNTTEKDIVDYVNHKTGEMITLEGISFKYPKEYKAYKFFVSENKMDIFLDDKLWPEGIIFRRFMHFKTRSYGANRNTISDAK